MDWKVYLLSIYVILKIKLNYDILKPQITNGIYRSRNPFGASLEESAWMLLSGRAEHRNMNRQTHKLLSSYGSEMLYVFL